MKALVYYLRLLVLPRGLSVEHAFTVAASAWDPAVLCALAVILSLATIIVRSVRRGDTGFWFAWIPVVLLPTLIVPLNVLVNEHRLYPVMVAAAVLSTRLVMPSKSAWRGCVAVLVVLCLGGLAYERSQVWQEAGRLWADARAKAPGMPRPWLFLGDAHLAANRLEEALTAYAEAERVNPAHLSAGDRLALHNNRGATLLALGRHDEAVRNYEAALRIVPDYEPAVASLAGLRALQGVQRDPRAERLKRGGLAALVAGDMQAAEKGLRASLAIESDDRTLLALGLVLERQQRDTEAVSLYQKRIHSATSSTTVDGARRRLESLQEGKESP